MKHLVFDVRHVESRIDGLGRYIVNLLNHLDTGKIRVTLLCKNDFPKEFLAHKESFSYVFLNVSLRNPIQNIEIYNLFKKLQVDVYFNPFIDGPLFTSAKRNVFAVHDLNHYFFSPIAATERSYAILYAKAAINIMALSYSSVIVFSDFVAKQVLQNTLVKKDMIKTIYHGFADFAINSKGNLPPYLNEQSYFLYVGNNRPHKNLKSLIDAFALSGLHERGYSLVIAGNQIPRFYDAREHINSKGINSVYIVESPSNEDLGSLYSNCLSVIYPSFSEGFGFPLLEAWNYKKPILCANASCLPEIGGDAALYFDPLSIEDISTTLKTIANDEKLREKLSYSGSERLLSFNWKSSAQKHLDVFFKLMIKDFNIQTYSHRSLALICAFVFFLPFPMIFSNALCIVACLNLILSTIFSGSQIQLKPLLNSNFKFISLLYIIEIIGLIYTENFPAAFFSIGKKAAVVNITLDNFYY